MTDPTDMKSMPGYESAAANYQAMSKSMQTFASEMQKMSKESMDAATTLMEKMKGAKTVEDVVSIQTSFMQQSFSKYADFTRKFSEMMMAVPMEIAKNSKTAMQQGTEAMTRAGEQAGEHMRQVSEQMTPHS